jgi:hypothetical protein
MMYLMAQMVGEMVGKLWHQIDPSASSNPYRGE